MNRKFMSEVSERTRPLAVDSMEEATRVIAKAIATGKDMDTDAFARHLAWLIGFDALIDDRKALHHAASFMVADPL